MEDMKPKKILIPIEKCVPGMTLMQSVGDERTGTIIIGKGQKLTEDIIEKIAHFNHTQIWIQMEEIENIKVEEVNNIKVEEGIWHVSKEQLETYKNYAHLLQNIIEGFNGDKSQAVCEIMTLADQILCSFTESYSALACTNLLNQLDADEYMRSINVASVAFVLGQWLEYDKEFLKDVIITCLFHDVGKIDLNSKFLKMKIQDMSGLEKLEYQRHPILGYEKLAPYNEVSVEVLKGVLTHHERLDGKGYPLHLKENKIGNLARIIALADTYICLKQSMHIFDVVMRLELQKGNKLDSKMVGVFCENILNYYIGSKVLLNTGEVAEIVFIQSKARHRPIIKTEVGLINLLDKSNLRIERIMG